MTRNDDFIRQLEEYLDDFEGPTPLPEAVRDTVRARLPSTMQRPAWWPERRFPTMNNVVRMGLAAAAVIVVAFVGIQLFGRANVGGPGPAETLSPTIEATSSPTPQAPSPTPAAAIPPAGPLAIGRHSFIVGGVPLSLELTTGGWVSNGEFGIDKDAGVGPEGAGFIFWIPGGSPDGVYSDPCAHVKSSPPGVLSLAEIAAAVSTVPGTDLVSGPSDVTVGGYPAKQVVLTVREDIGCGPEQFYLWYNQDTERYATALGSTIRVWIIETPSGRVWIDGETYMGAGPEPGQELQQIIDSIQFEAP